MQMPVQHEVTLVREQSLAVLAIELVQPVEGMMHQSDP